MKAAQNAFYRWNCRPWVLTVSILRALGEWSFTVPFLDLSGRCWCFRYLSITANYTKEWEKWWKNPQQVSDNTQLFFYTVPFYQYHYRFLLLMRIFTLSKLAYLTKEISFISFHLLQGLIHQCNFVKALMKMRYRVNFRNWEIFATFQKRKSTSFQMSIETSGAKFPIPTKLRTLKNYPLLTLLFALFLFSLVAKRNL